MRHFTSVLLALLGCGIVHGQERLQIVSADQEPRKMLYKFLLAEAQKHFDARKKLVASLKTPDEIQRRQRELKAKFIEAIGGFPKEKTPLNAQVVGVIKGDGFRVEKVIYESRPNHHVTANFYIPDGKGPFPGVLVPCGHSDNGKAAEAYQRACILMAKNGLAVLCYDPIGQGERLQLLADNKKGAIKGSTSEHTMVGVGALLVGQSTAGYRIWDGIRSIDFLVSRPEIDFNKIGCTGNSGGGTLTAYLMALDDRIACAAPSCYITSLERLFTTIGPQDAEQNIPGQVAFGMEHVDYLTLRAPKPTLMCIGSQDYFDQQGSWATFREASQVFAKLGHGERVAMFEYDDKHGFSKPRREAAMRWMRRWLLNIDDAPSEGDFAVFKDADLQCTRSGQVLADFKGVSAFGLNALEAKRYETKRAKFAKLDEKQRQAEIRRLLGLSLPDGRGSEIPTANLLSQKIHYLEDRLSTHKVVYETEKGILIPGLRFKHIQPKGPPVIYVPDRGLPEDGKLPKWLVEKYEKKHQEIYIFDLRGLGETAPAAKSAYFGADMKEAFLAMHLNRPLLGQRVLDVLSLMKAINSDNVEIVAAGVTGPIALHAAALDQRIREISLDGAVRSWRTVVERPITYNELTNVVPGVLRVYDLPDLEATLAPRKVTTREILN
ncbi:MAG: acetylxylan esterase [Planctomycetes bacterium]|nr:acetylxylan esterase [Planctomycetota bacterium]